MTGENRHHAYRLSDEQLKSALRSFMDAYPVDIFPVPPPSRQAKDGAAAHVMRRVALPWMGAAADMIEALQRALYQAAVNRDADEDLDLDHETGLAHPRQFGRTQP